MVVAGFSVTSASSPKPDPCGTLNAESFCGEEGMCVNLVWLDGSETYMMDKWKVMEDAANVEPVSCAEADEIVEGNWDGDAMQHFFDYDYYSALLQRLKSILSHDILGALSRFPFEALEDAGNPTLLQMMVFSSLLTPDDLRLMEHAAVMRHLYGSSEFDELDSFIATVSEAVEWVSFSPSTVVFDRFAQFAWLTEDIEHAQDPYADRGLTTHDDVLAAFPPRYRGDRPVVFVSDDDAVFAPLDEGWLIRRPDKVHTILNDVRAFAIQMAQDASSGSPAPELTSEDAIANAELMEEFETIVKAIAARLVPHEAASEDETVSVLLPAFRDVVCPILGAVAFWIRIVTENQLEMRLISTSAAICRSNTSFDERIGAFMGRLQQGTVVGLSSNPSEMMQTSEIVLRERACDWLRGDLIVQFDADVGIGYTGPRKLWISTLVSHVFPNGGFMDEHDIAEAGRAFTFTDERRQFVHVAHLRGFIGLDNARQISTLRLAGRVIGLALRYGVPVGLRCAPSFVPLLFGLKAQEPASIIDLDAFLAEEDPAFLHGLAWLESIDWTDAAAVETNAGWLTFDTLFSDGATVKVDGSNWRDYVMRSKVRKVIEVRSLALGVLREAIDDVISPGALLSLTEAEFSERVCLRPNAISAQILLGGMALRDFDLANAMHLNIKNWLMEILMELSIQQLTEFHMFVCATPLPPAGAAETWIKVFLEPQLSPDSLPRAHTCHNELQLPLYTSKDQMRSKLLLAISETATISGHADYMAV